MDSTGDKTGFKVKQGAQRSRSRTWTLPHLHPLWKSEGVSVFIPSTRVPCWRQNETKGCRGSWKGTKKEKRGTTLEKHATPVCPPKPDKKHVDRLNRNFPFRWNQLQVHTCNHLTRIHERYPKFTNKNKPLGHKYDIIKTISTTSCRDETSATVVSFSQLLSIISSDFSLNFWYIFECPKFSSCLNIPYNLYLNKYYISLTLGALYCLFLTPKFLVSASSIYKSFDHWTPEYKIVFSILGYDTLCYQACVIFDHINETNFTSPVSLFLQIPISL